MKSPIFYLIFTLLLFAASTSILAHEEHGPTGQIDLIYDVTFSNEVNYVWYDSIEDEASSYHVLNNSQVILNITDISDPQSTYNITIGNITKLDVPDYIGEDVLVLGYISVPKTFGFIANTTWLDSKDALEAISPEISNFELTEFSFPRKTLLGGELHTALIEFSDSFQSTSLLYEQDSGILLQMNSTAGGYSLSLSISSINENPEYYFEAITETKPPITSEEISFSIYYSLIAITVMISIFYRKQ